MTEEELMDAEMRGFDDGTSWALDPDPDAPNTAYSNPPKGQSDCAGCLSVFVCAADASCLRCRYALGFTEGASK